MTMKLFAIRDNKVGTYLMLVMFAHLAEALRAFGKIVSDPNSQLFQFSKDFDLYQLGELDTISGIILPEVSFISTCSEILSNELKCQRELKELMLNQQNLNPETTTRVPAFKKAENAEGSEAI